MCVGVFSFGFHDVLMGFGHGDQCTHLNFASEFKGQLGVPPTVYPWYLLCSLGILEDYNPYINTHEL